MTKIPIIDDPPQEGGTIAWWICYHCRTEFPERSKTADIVGFAKNVLGIELFPYQEELLLRAEKGEAIVYARRPGRKTFERIVDEFRQFRKLHTLS